MSEDDFDDDGEPIYAFDLGDQDYIALMPISKATHDELIEYDLGGDAGYFIMKGSNHPDRRSQGFELLGKVHGGRYEASALADVLALKFPWCSREDFYDE